MIVKKQLLLLIYTLQIICVLGEDSLIHPKENETNNPRKIVSLDHIDYFTFPKVNDTYPRALRNVDKFFDGTIKFDQTNLLLDNYLRNDGTIFDASTESFETEPFLCNTTGRLFYK